MPGLQAGRPSLNDYDGPLKRQYPSKGGSKYREGDLLEPNEWLLSQAFRLDEYPFIDSPQRLELTTALKWNDY